MPRLKYRIDPAAIYQLRERNSITQEELATKLNVSVNTVQKWEQGRATPQPRNLRTLLRLMRNTFGTGVGQFISGNQSSLN
jgi:DNA-binding transcriptional regulator YiaG